MIIIIIPKYQYISHHHLPLSFHPLSYFRHAAGVLVVYDITNRKEYNNVEGWLTELKQYAGTNINIMLVGNKCDMIHHREVSTDEAKQFAGISNYYD